MVVHMVVQIRGYRETWVDLKDRGGGHLKEHLPQERGGWGGVSIPTPPATDDCAILVLFASINLFVD